MVDFADRAQDITENHLALSIANRSVLTTPFSGRCLSCDEPVEERRFCDSSCRQNHERSNQLKFRR
jgi:hypothetical protein